MTKSKAGDWATRYQLMPERVDDFHAAQLAAWGIYLEHGCWCACLQQSPHVQAVLWQQAAATGLKEHVLEVVAQGEYVAVYCLMKLVCHHPQPLRAGLAGLRAAAKQRGRALL